MRKNAASGLTLVELLVVVIILTTIVATVIPILAPSVEKRRIREAARGLSAFISAARARAIQIDRPVGVMIERMDSEIGASMLVSMAEVPPPFGGWTQNDTVTIDFLPGSNTGTAKFSNNIPPGMIRPGDRLKLNYQGHVFEFIQAVNPRGSYYPATDTLQVQRVIGDTGLIPTRPGTNTTYSMPYQILRQPVRSGTAAYQLPEGVVIDLFGSGTDDDEFHFPADNNSNRDPITLTFAPNGSLDFLYHNEETDAAPEFRIERSTYAIHLLVGKREAVGDSLRPNWFDLECVWVSIGSQTGQVAVAENAAQVSGSSDLEIQIAEARRFAREMHSMGGR